MFVWIDVTNSPHVLFFRPIIKELKKKGHEVIVTYRDFAQTKGLLENFKIEAIEVGNYGGKTIIGKIYNLLKRSFLLLKMMKSKKIDLALSHNSIDICLVSRLLNIKCVDIFDYEFAQFHHINIRCANKVMCPKYISLNSLKKYGCSKKKLISYPFLKEQMYLSDYKFDNNILEKLNINKNKIIVVFRPPADMSLYHKGIKNDLYYDLINYLSLKENVCVVFLARSKEQKEFILNKKLNNFIVPKTVIDAPSLIKKADVVISAGGTMNREAVALGVPVYTSLALKLGGVDKYLISKKLLVKLNKVSDLKLKKNKRNSYLKFYSSNFFIKIFENLF